MGSKIATKMFDGWSCERKISLMVTVACWGSKIATKMLE